MLKSAIDTGKIRYFMTILTFLDYLCLTLSIYVCKIWLIVQRRARIMATSNFRSNNEFPLFAKIETDGDLEMDYWLIEKELKKDNQSLENYEIQIIGGYYEGLQIYVEQKDKTDNIETEKQKVLEIMNRIKGDYNMIELVVVARFSNGETIYKEKE